MPMQLNFICDLILLQFKIYKRPILNQNLWRNPTRSIIVFKVNYALHNSKWKKNKMLYRYKWFYSFYKNVD